MKNCKQQRILFTRQKMRKTNAERRNRTTKDGLAKATTNFSKNSIKDCQRD